jgi:hypothetical protein
MIVPPSNTLVDHALSADPAASTRDNGPAARLVGELETSSAIAGWCSCWPVSVETLTLTSTSPRAIWFPATPTTADHTRASAGVQATRRAVDDVR